MTQNIEKVLADDLERERYIKAIMRGRDDFKSGHFLSHEELLQELKDRLKSATKKARRSGLSDS